MPENAPPADPKPSTTSEDYARYLAERRTGWKRWIDVQWPYRRHLRAMSLGTVLDLGCGVGRNLEHLRGLGPAVGVDHNVECVRHARARGLEAYTPETFARSGWAPDAFDTLLTAHVLEHVDADRQAGLLGEYLPYVRPGGRIVVITPQEAGFRSDPTHVTWCDFARIDTLLDELALTPVRHYSFPFVRPLGRLFKYNEFITVAKKPGRAVASGRSRPSAPGN